MSTQFNQPAPQFPIPTPRSASTLEDILYRARDAAAEYGPNVAIEAVPSQSKKSTVFYVYDGDDCTRPPTKTRLGSVTDRDVVAVGKSLLAEFGKRGMEL